MTPAGDPVIPGGQKSFSFAILSNFEKNIRYYKFDPWGDLGHPLGRVAMKMHGINGSCSLQPCVREGDKVLGRKCEG